MTSGLQHAVDAYRQARDAAEEARLQLAEAIAAEARAGTRQAEIVRITGYTRERIRQICRAAGVEPGE